MSNSFVDLGGYYVLPSETNRWVHYYLALDVKKIHEPKQDNLIEKYFDISVHLLPFEEVSTIKGATGANITGLESLHGITLAREYLDSMQ